MRGTLCFLNIRHTSWLFIPSGHALRFATCVVSFCLILDSAIFVAMYNHLLHRIRSFVSSVCLLTLLFVSPSVSAQTDYQKQLDSLLATHSVRPFNGVVFITWQGKEIYAKAHGYANKDTQVPLRLEDRFSTMSIAKQITAVLVLQEVEQGHLALDTPIKKYLPDFEFAWGAQVTPHMLLNHTAGVASEGVIETLKNKPGAAFNYSNAGYGLLAALVVRVSGRPYAELVEALFKKCGMKHSAYPTAKNSNQLVKGHTVSLDGSITVNESVTLPEELFGGSHLQITAPDLAKWNECLHTGQLLTPAMYQRMVSYTVTAIHPVFNSRPIGYGYGLRINDKADLKEFGHTGFHPSQGFTAINLYYPESRVGIVVLENQAYENFDIAYHFEKEIRRVVYQAILSKSLLGK